MNKNRLIVALMAAILLFSVSKAHAASNFKVKFKLANGISMVNCISPTGVMFPGVIANGQATVTIKAAEVEGTSCFALDDEGRLIGPVYAPKGSNGLLAFVKTPKNKKKKTLKAVNVTLVAPDETQNYVMIEQTPKGSVYSARYKYTPQDTPTLGLNLGQSASQVKGKIKATAVFEADQDSDGFVDAIDADQDGDGILNLADASTESSSSIGTLAEEEEEEEEPRRSDVSIPFTTLYLSMPDTLNWRINQALTQGQIDAVIGGENKFSIAFYFGLSTHDYPTISGGHVICDSSLEYCRPTSFGASTGIYSGFSDGDSSLQGLPWSSITTDGSEYSLEQMSGGGDSGITLAAAIQPRVGTDKFRPGDVYRVDFTNSSAGVVTSRPLILPPYFVSVPAIKSFNTTSNDAGSDVVVDYTDSSGLGRGPGNPIVLASSGGFSGKLRLNFWRLQRLAIPPSETGSYRDYGHLNYGVTINNNAGEFTCGGLFSNLSSTLTELPSQGEGGSYQTNQGALIWPLVDSSDDFDPESTDPADIANESLSFTVDLASCLTRNGLSAGTHGLNLFAAGVDTGHGSNRAAQTLYVQIP